MIPLVFFFVGLVVGFVAISPFLIARYKDLRVRQRALEEAERQLLAKRQSIEARESDIGRAKAELSGRVQEFESRIIAYDELRQENQMLKRDLQNVDVNINKLELDHRLQREKQEQISARSTALGARYLKETVKDVVSSVGANNFAACKQRLLSAIEWCREIGLEVSASEEANLLAELRSEFERAVKAAYEREEQARIKAQIREEQKLQKEIVAERQRIERERAAIQAALDRALADARNLHTEEVQRLQARLADAEERAKRTMSMAQQTKAGHVYVISNIGSFGHGVFKVGMTRRLNPAERVHELGDASVPFPFDIHMMIHCEDAPSLENALHRGLHKLKMNRVNPRKEYFKTDVQTIVEIVKQHHGEVEYIADPEALEYNQSLTMSAADTEYIEKVFDEVEEETSIADDA